jgi:hypothetical protein
MQLGREMEELYDDDGMDKDDKPGYAWDGIQDYIEKCRHLKRSITS